MYKIHAFYTDDGSVGLYSPHDNDIYHSVYGALTESYEKFILPINLKKFFSKKNKIKILDICYGIGYNSKSFLNEYFKFFYNDTIHGDNIYPYTGKIYFDNIIPGLTIHAVDIDKNLVYLSPFFISNKKHVINNNIDFDKNKLIKKLSNKFSTKYKLNKIINFLLLNKLADGIDSDIEKILFNPKNSKYFDKRLKEFYRLLKFKKVEFIPRINKLSFLHNIYYKYISLRHKKALNSLKLLDFNFKVDICDARLVISRSKDLYDVIFLDAFSPDKSPCLWTLDFFKLLYEHLNDDGIILTYSSSARVRNAFLNAGFFIGKNIINENSCGTIASKNKMLIKNELSEFDLGLLKTKAGIFYRDENLNASNEDIIKNRNIEIKKSNLMSSTKYLKSLK